jgi:hypothetical protein
VISGAEIDGSPGSMVAWAVTADEDMRIAIRMALNGFQ